MNSDMDFETGKFWGAGVAVAVVAGLTGWLTFLIADALFSAELLIPAKPGSDRLVTLTGSDVFRTGLVAGLVATAILWLLILAVPTPVRFFGWIAGLAVVAVTILPFSFSVTTQNKVWLAAINLVMGLTILSLLEGIIPKVLLPRGAATASAGPGSMPANRGVG
jgi:hypothetical protein